MTKKLIVLLLFCLSFSFLPIQAQTFLEELKDLNGRYRGEIFDKEQTSVGDVPVDKLDRINSERFNLIAGVRRQIREDGPTEREWFEITESVWQHAACIMEKETVYDDKTGFENTGLKSEVSSLFHLTLGKGNFKDLDQAHQGNALALLSATFYALNLLTSHLLPKGFCFWGVAGLEEYKPADLFEGDFKTSMDDYFRTVCGKLRTKQLKLDSITPQDDKKTLSKWGHFTFFLSFDDDVEIDFTAVIRTYVTGGYEKQIKSPFYGVRVGLKEKIETHYSSMTVHFKGKVEKNFDIPLKPLVASDRNTFKFPLKKVPHWLTGEDFRRNELRNQFTFTTTFDKSVIISTQLHFTLKKEEKATRLTNKIPGEYIHIMLDQYMIYPRLQSLTYSDRMTFL